MGRGHFRAVALCLMSLFLFQTPGNAQKLTSVHGAGGNSCGKYVQVYDAYRPFLDGTTGGFVAWRASANYWQYEEWIYGYIFGADGWNKRPIRSFDQAAMQIWIYNYCQQHPVDVVAN